MPARAETWRATLPQLNLVAGLKGDGVHKKGDEGAEASSVMQDASRRTILVVEDDPDMSDMLAGILEHEGFVVQRSDSAFAVARMVQDLEPAVVILDLGLPYRPGSALLDELKSEPGTANVPVIVVSGLTEGLSPERSALAAAVVSKPFTIDELVTAVRRSADGVH